MMSDISGTLATVQFLRQHGLEELVEKYKLNTRQHKEFPNLIQFKYDQIKSPMEHQIVQECRGLILDKKDNWKVICLPYKKFFNWNESNAAQIDWTTARVFEKMDGSLATLYWYGEKWQVSSSGVPDGSGLIDDGISFADLFWDIWKKSNFKFPKETKYCYMFELVSQRNIIVVRPDRDAVVLHGVRDMSNLQELDPVPIGQFEKWEIATTYPFSTQEEILSASKKLNPVSCGYVVCDKEFNRVKIKSPAYVALAHLSVKNALGLNNRFMLQIVRIHEDDEFLAYYPKYTRLHKVVKAQYDQLCKNVQELYNNVDIQLKKNPESTYWTEMHKLTQSQKYRDILTKMYVNKIEDVKTYCQLTDIGVLSKYIESETVQIWNGEEKDTEHDEKKLYEEIEGIVHPLSKADKKKQKKSLKKPAKQQGFEIDDVTMVPGAKKETSDTNNNNQNTASENNNNNNNTPKEPEAKSKASKTKAKKKTDKDLDLLIAQFRKLDELQQQKKEQVDIDTPTRASKKKSKKKK